MCDFTSKSADDYIKHIEIKHQKKDESIKEYACDRCDYKGRSEGQFKTHLEVAHKLNVGGFTNVSHSKKSKNLCISWNQGHCTYGQRCRFEHNEIPPCMFKDRCAKADCKYWHEASTGKFPFLGYRSQQSFPNRRN